MISKYFGLSQINRELNEECISARLALKQDFIEADSVFWSEDVLKIYKQDDWVNWYSEKQDLKRFEFKNQNEMEKAFRLGTHFLEVKILDQKSWVASLQLNLMKNEKPYRTLTFYKDYPVSNFIN